MPAMRARRWSAAVLAVGASAAGPNFLFFMPDEMRAESMGVYGGLAPTPNFQRLADEGVRFEQCHTSYTVCSQSRAAFMTGWPTHVAGHRSLWSLLSQWEPNLLKYLKASGYEVKWWGKNDLLAEDAFPDSVDTAESKPGVSQFKSGNIAGDNISDPRFYSFLSKPLNSSLMGTSDGQNVQSAINFLRHRKTSGDSKPFAIYLPLTFPHPPYTAPEPYYSLINRSSIPPLRPRDAPGQPDFHDLVRKYRNLEKLDDDFFRELHAVYLGMISYSDFLLGRLLDVLEETGLSSDTYVFVWADHGDYAGDWGLVEKWPSGLEDVLTRVPLFVRGPRLQRGAVVGPQPVQLFNLLPTVLELANATVNHTHFATSLMPQLRGDSAMHPEAAIFAEGGYGTFEPRDNEGWPGRSFSKPKPTDVYYPKRRQQGEQPLSVCRAVMVRTASAKLVLRMDPSQESSTVGQCGPCQGSSELYNLTADPRELKNIFQESGASALRAQLTDRLFRWLMTTSDVAKWADDSRDTPHIGKAGAAGLSPSEAFMAEETELGHAWV